MATQVLRTNIDPPPEPKQPRVYVCKKTYGKMPQYPKKEVKIEKQEVVEKKENKLEEETRITLLQGLKENWQKLNSEYQKLSLTVDTIPKIARKLNLETRLKKLEQDIQLFSNKNIYIK